MSVRLVREPSEAPNIQNKDDAKMIRYAYGGYDGVVKAYGKECAYTFENGVFKIGSGRIVLQGWEVDIDESGWELDISGITSTRYYKVFLEVNLVNQMAQILYFYGSSSYPVITYRDDLTTYPNGIARMELYTFVLKYGEISQVECIFQKIDYLKDWVKTLEDDINDTAQDIRNSYESGELEVKYSVYAFGGDDSKGTIEERLNSGLLKSYTALSGSISITEKGIYAVYYHDPAFNEGVNSSAVLCIPDLNVTVIDASTLVKYDSSTKTIVRYRTNAVVYSAYLIARL